MMLAATVLSLLNVCLAGNPLVPNVGMADPHAHVFNDRVYIYATHDFSNNNTGFRMLDWWVWSSDDLVNWKKEYVLEPMPWETEEEKTECWATDAAQRDGKYYFYVSVGPSNIAVVTSDNPGGPFSDPLGKPLVSQEDGSKLNPKATPRDPCSFQDDDGSYYLIFGVFDYYIAKLADNMTALAEAPRLVTVNNAMGSFGPNKTDDKPFIHKYNKKYYLSWGCFYGIADSVYGPYDYVGTAVDPNTIAPDFRVGPMNPEPWYTSQNYLDRHGSFFSLNGQWYYVMNDRSHSTDKTQSVYRDSVAAYVHYFSNGTIAPVVINAEGVGRHNATRGRLIPAVHYYSLENAYKFHHENNHFIVAGITNKTVIGFKNIYNVGLGTIMSLRIGWSSFRPISGHVEVFSYASHELIAVCNLDKIKHEGDINKSIINWNSVACSWKTDAAGSLDLKLQFHLNTGSSDLFLESLAFL
eukprot:m.342381 g.342381  ORF g.342381 m.342381 type:complete len:467 (+) comp21319_c0_seq1:31-1431(+)